MFRDGLVLFHWGYSLPWLSHSFLMRFPSRINMTVLHHMHQTASKLTHSFHSKEWEAENNGCGFDAEYSHVHIPFLCCTGLGSCWCHGVRTIL